MEKILFTSESVAKAVAEVFQSFHKKFPPRIFVIAR